MRAGMAPSLAAARRARAPQPPVAPSACARAFAIAPSAAATRRLPPRRARALALAPVCAAKRPGGSLATRLVRCAVCESSARPRAVFVADAACVAPAPQSRIASTLPQRVDLYFERRPFRRYLCAHASRSRLLQTHDGVSHSIAPAASAAQVVWHQWLRRLLRRQHCVALLWRAGGERHRRSGAGGDVRRARDARVLHSLAKPVRSVLSLRSPPAHTASSSHPTARVTRQAFLAVAAALLQGAPLARAAVVRARRR
jgi:hypothetical protein